MARTRNGRKNNAESSNHHHTRNEEWADSEETQFESIRNNGHRNEGSQDNNNMQGFANQLVQALREVIPLANQHANGGNRIVNQFREMKPPVLKGNEGPIAAEEWIRQTERIFNYLRCDDEQKVSCAVFQLTEDAGHWWESQTRVMTREQQEGLTWNNFKEMVMGKFFPRAFRKEKEMELMNLVQGNLTMLEYEQKFNQLSRYAPHLVDTDEKKAWRFENGLRTEIGGFLAALNLTSYSAVVERAQAIATRLKLDNLVPKPSSEDGKRRWDNRGKGKDSQVEKKPRSDGNSNARAVYDKPQCPQCGKFHNGKCMIGGNSCFRCHEGHFASNCPKFTNRNNNAGRNHNNNVGRGGNARAFAMNQEGEKED